MQRLYLLAGFLLVGAAVVMISVHAHNPGTSVAEMRMASKQREASARTSPAAEAHRSDATLIAHDPAVMETTAAQSAAYHPEEPPRVEDETWLELPDGSVGRVSPCWKPEGPAQE